MLYVHKQKFDGKICFIFITGICPSPFELIANSTLGAPGTGTIQAATVNTTELCKVNGLSHLSNAVPAITTKPENIKLSKTEKRIKISHYDHQFKELNNSFEKFLTILLLTVCVTF